MPEDKHLVSLNLNIARHPGMAAILALAASLLIHAVLLVSIDELPVRNAKGERSMPRYVPVEVANVSRTLPPREETLSRAELDNPGVLMPVDAEVTAHDAAAITAPAMPVLPIPELAPLKLESTPWLPTSTRLEAMHIPEPRHDEADSALPRRWIEADIPRMDQAPDIQLPVELDDSLVTKGSFDAAAIASWHDTEGVGTPDWQAVIAGRQVLGDAITGTTMAPVRPSRPDDVAAFLDERPEHVSALESIEELLQIRASGYRSSDGHLYFAMRIEPVDDQALPVQPRDVLLVQDSSGSMTPQKMDECRRGLRRWLDFLNPGDRFDLVGFSDDIRPCFGEWRAYDAAARREAMAFIDGLRAVGNTDIFLSLQEALDRTWSPERTMVLVLMTDGRPTVGVTGSSDIIERITRRNQGRISIFAVGGGRQVNSFFLDLISFRNRGDANVVTQQEGIPVAMEDLARQLRRPVLTDLTYRFSGMDGSEIYPRQLANLFLDRPLVIYGRVPSPTGPLAFHVVGRSGQEWRDFLFVVDEETMPPGTADLKNRWAWQKIYHMIGDYLGDPSPAWLENIRNFSDAYGLLVPYGFSRAVPRRM